MDNKKKIGIIAGIAAYYMKKCGYPMAPIVLAFVLGPIFELKARQALEISNCNLDHYPKCYCNRCQIYCPAGSWKETFGDTGLSRR